jgi:hypothetical protein
LLKSDNSYFAPIGAKILSLFISTNISPLRGF